MKMNARMQLAAASFALTLLGACGDSSPPQLTSEECAARGGRVIANPGPQASCAGGEKLLGHIPFGIEGAICCGPTRAY